MAKNSNLYTRIVASIAHEAKTIAQIADEIGCEKRYVMLALRAMHGRVAHIEGYNGGPGLPARWRIGMAPDAVPPRPRANRHPKSRGSPERTAFVVLLGSIMAAPHSQPELERLSGYGHGAVRRALRALKGYGLVRIGAWDRAGHVGPFSAYWEWAPGKPNVPKPKRIDAKESCRRWGQASRQKARAARLINALHGTNSEQFALRA